MGYYGYPMMGYDGSWFPMVILWAIFILAVVVFVRWALGMGGAIHYRDKAIDILKERYAKGEIGKAEFEEKKRDLSAP